MSDGVGGEAEAFDGSGTQVEAVKAARASESSLIWPGNMAGRCGCAQTGRLPGGSVKLKP
jgi:hypothetical protein